MSKIEKIISNLETIKSRDTANHRDECKCELCESLAVAKDMKNIIKIVEKYNDKILDLAKTKAEVWLHTYINFIIKSL